MKTKKVIDEDPVFSLSTAREKFANYREEKNLENSAVATRLEKVSFHSNPECTTYVGRRRPSVLPKERRH